MRSASVVAGLPAVLVAITLALTGCSASPEPNDSAGETSAPGTTSSVPTTGPAPVPTTAPAPPPPVVADGPCPYLDRGFVEQTIGQRLARSETITVAGAPLPGCAFYKPDDSPGLRVDVGAYPEEISAQNAALATVTNGADPLTDLGDYGGVIVTPGQTLLAVTSGSTLIVVTTNQESSLGARGIATAVLAALPA